MSTNKAIWLAALVLLAPGSRSWADDVDTANVFVSRTVQHINNLFLLSSSVDANLLPGSPARNDTASVTDVGITVNKLYSLQRFEFDADAAENRYANNTFLDFTAKNYTADWHWYLTPSVKGELSSSRQEGLNSFAYNNLYNVASLHIIRTEAANVDWTVLGPWHVVAAAKDQTLTNSQIYLETQDYRLRTVEGGIKYVFPTYSSLALVDRIGNGDYINQTDIELSPISQIENRYRQDEKELQYVLQLSTTLSLSGRFAHLTRDNVHFQQRNYSGNVGGVNALWAVTQKTQVVVYAARDLYPYQSDFTSYTKTDRISVSPTWQSGAKTSVQLEYDWYKRDFLGAIAITPENGRSDVGHTKLIELNWLPADNVTLSAYVRKDLRSSNNFGFDYASRTLGLTAKISF